MKTEFKYFCYGSSALLATCALLVGAVPAQADSLVLFPNGDFDHPAGTNAPWVETFGGGTPTYSYPTTGGNPNGYGVIDMTSDTAGWAIWVGGNTTPLPLAPMGMIPGNTYNFVQDMISIVDGDGNHPPGVKIESWGPGGKISDSGDMTVTITSTWQTYSFPYTIAAGATGIKVVPLWSSSGMVGYDNIGVMVPPQPLVVSVTSPADGATVSTNFTITATAAVSPEAVTNVYFYDGTTLLGNNPGFPYSLNVSGASLGTHALQVVALDSGGNAATSAVVNVTVAGLVPPAPNYPTNNAPTPTMAAADVISLYNSSATYINISPVNWYPWGSTASSGDFTISGGRVVKSYLGLGYAGVEVNPSYNPATALDISAMNTFHLDVWTTANQIAIKLVSTINGAAPEVIYPASSGVITSNHWVSLDIPLSAFTNLVPTLDLTHIDQLLWVDNGDIPGSGIQQGDFYVDNVYFYSNLVVAPPASTTVYVDPSQSWIGYMNVFDLPVDGGAYEFGSAWGTDALPAVFDGAVLTLSPNTNNYNPSDSYWVNSDGSGNKICDASMYVQNDSLAGQAVTFTGYCQANTLVSPYASTAFIKDFNSSYGLNGSISTSLTNGQSFSFSLATAAGDHIQYGFETVGPVADPATVASLGSVLVSSNVLAVLPTMATSLSGGVVHMSYPTQAGLNYTIQYKTNLTDSVWQTLSTLSGNGSTQTVPDTANQISRFYRLYVH